MASRADAAALALARLMAPHGCCCCHAHDPDGGDLDAGFFADHATATATAVAAVASRPWTAQGLPAPRPVASTTPNPFAAAKPDAPRNIMAKGLQRFEKKRSLPPQPDSEVLSERVVCILGQNPSAFTLNGTNCYLVGTGKARLLVDTGDHRHAPKMLRTLKRVMREVGCTQLAGILVTHMHFDHYGGVEQLHANFGRHVPVYKFPLYLGSTLALNFLHEVRGAGIEEFLVDAETGKPKWDFTAPEQDDAKTPEMRYMELLELAESAGFQMNWDRRGRTRDEVIREYAFNRSREIFEEYLHRTGTLRAVPPPHVPIRVEGATLYSLHTPGHAPDHVAFFLEEERAIFSGDNVLGFGTTFVNRLYEYMHSLRAMRDCRPKRLYPGHGPIIEDGEDYLTRYITHRQQRENQLRDFFEADCNRGVPTPARAITREIYGTDDPRRLFLAHQNISKLLVMLLRENFVEARVARVTHVVAHDSVAPGTADTVTPATTVTDDEVVPERRQHSHGSANDDDNAEGDNDEDEEDGVALYVPWVPEHFMRYDNLPDDILWVKRGDWPTPSTDPAPRAAL